MKPDVVLLTTVEVAALLRVDRHTVLRWVADGKVPVIVLPGGTYRFRRTDIEAILAGNQTVDV
jgi:excisionase family DNA binding protein